MRVGWDLSGVIVHNNKSLGTGDLPEGYGSGDPAEVLRAFENGELPILYYLTCGDDIVFIDGALDAIAMLTKAGIPQYILTNQEQIGVGIISDATWMWLMTMMNKWIEESGGRIDKWYWCPHVPGAGCLCRKRTKKPGLHMFYRCALEGGFNLPEMVMVGDNISDMTSAVEAGCGRTIMVKTLKEYPGHLTLKYVDHMVDDALEAAKLIVSLRRE